MYTELVESFYDGLPVPFIKVQDELHLVATPFDDDDLNLVVISHYPECNHGDADMEEIVHKGIVTALHVFQVPLRQPDDPLALEIAINRMDNIINHSDDL